MDDPRALIEGTYLERYTISETEIESASALSAHLRRVEAAERDEIEAEAMAIARVAPRPPVAAQQQMHRGPVARALSLQDIRSRCEEIGDCWIWKQGLTGNGVPCVRSRGRGTLVRREVVFLRSGREAAKGWFAVAFCGEALCVAPKCVRLLSPKDYVAWLNRIGKLNSPAQAIVMAAVAARRSRVSDEAADRLRQQIADGVDRGHAAREAGISRSWANRIAAGSRPTRGARGSSVFNQRI